MTPKRIGLVIILFLAGMVATVVLAFTKRFEAYLLYVVLALLITTVLVKLVRPFWVKWTIATVSLFAFWAVGHVDEFLGKREHRELCEKYAGVKVFKKAKLPPEFYDADGTPNFFIHDEPDRERLKNYILFKHENAVVVTDKFLRIEKWVYRITDLASGDLLAENTDFAAWPSQFVMPLPVHEEAERCGPINGIPGNKLWGDMFHEVFDPQLIQRSDKK